MTRALYSEYMYICIMHAQYAILTYAVDDLYLGTVTTTFFEPHLFVPPCPFILDPDPYIFWTHVEKCGFPCSFPSSPIVLRIFVY